MKKNIIIISLIFIFSLLYGETDGEKAFKGNNPELAIQLLEEEIQEGNVSPYSYNFLGLSYFQTGNPEKAAEVFAKGLTVSGTNKKVLAFNQGNAYYVLKMYDEAIRCYSLAITMDKNFTTALLNRANAYVAVQKFNEAVEDYENYIAVLPDDPQYDEICEMIKALKQEIGRLREEEILAQQEAERLAEEERILQEELERQRLEAEKKAEEERILREQKEAEERRIAEEQRRIQEEKEAEERRIREEKEAEERRIREEREAEEKRIAEEKRAAEAERRRKLLEEVANSLQNVDSTNMSSGAEDLIEYEHESELD